MKGSSRALGDPNGFAGDFEVGAIADASEDDTMPGADFSNDTLFPTGTAKANIATVKDGKVVRAAGEVTVPVVPKW